MKGVTINGVEYLPATALAKQFRYTTDYIGQLCRAKKVDAQLVGRSWYVNPLSLTSHKKTRYIKPVIAKDQGEETDVAITRVEVAPVLTKNNIKNSLSSPKNFAKRIDWKPLKYEVDERELFPRLRPELEPKRVFVGLAEATDITIKTSSKTTNLVAEDLPTVSMKGSLSITTLDEDYTSDSEEVEDSVPIPVPDLQPEKVAVRYLHNSLPAKHFHKQLAVQKIAKPTLPVPAVSSVAEDEVSEGRSVLEITLITSSYVLTAYLLMLFFAESSVVATARSYDSIMSFSTQSLAALGALFFWRFVLVLTGRECLFS